MYRKENFTPLSIFTYKTKMMGKIAFFTTLLGVFSLNLMAQTGKYFGVRAQFGGVLSETSAMVSTKGGFSGGIGFAYMYVLNNKWDISVDGTLSVFSLQSNERDFDAFSQTWTTLGERKINFMTPEMAFMLNNSFAENRRFKNGAGFFVSKNIQKTTVAEQANYWGNAALIEENYAINISFLTGLNYGLCLESSVNLGVFQLSARYKHGLTNVNTEGAAWRQHFLQLGVTYFFGAHEKAAFRHILDDNQRYGF